MSVQEKIVADDATSATETATPVKPADISQTDPIATMFYGFGEFTDKGIGRIALIGSKVLLFNVFAWGPIAALGYMIFFW